MKLIYNVIILLALSFTNLTCRVISLVTPTDNDYTFESSTLTASLEKCEFIELLSVLNCENISDLSSIDTNVQSVPASSIQSLYVWPRTRLRLDSKFSLSGTTEEKFKDNFEVSLWNFGSFDQNANPFDSFYSQGHLLSIVDSDFEFYSSFHNNSALSEVCALIDNGYRPLFSAFKRVIMDTTVHFLGHVCPIVFQNANLKRFVISQVSESNKFQFSALEKLDDSTISRLNATIESFEVYKASLKSLESSLFDKHVFSRTKQFVYHSLESLIRIQDDLFESFENVNEFILNVPDLEAFLRNQDLLWISSLNPNVNVNLTNYLGEANKFKQVKLKLRDINDQYTFPDEDLCLFVAFPHEKLILPVIETASDLYCSCTLVWLTQYYPYYSYIDELITPTLSKCNHKENFEELVSSCNFEVETKKCNNLSLSSTLESTRISSTLSTYMQSTKSQLSDKCEFYSDASILKCENILDLSNINADEAEVSSIETLYIKPKFATRLDRSLSFSGSGDRFKENYDASLINFDGFNLNANPFEKLNAKGGTLDLSELSLEFFSSAHDSVSLSDTCVYVKTNYAVMFSSFENILISESANFGQLMCPLMFKDANIKRLAVSKMTESNRFNFTKLDVLENETGDVSTLLNSSVIAFEIYKSSLKYVRKSLLDETVFKSLAKFVYHSLEPLPEFQNDLFKSLKSLRELQIYVPDLGNYLRNTHLAWINSINFDLTIDLSSTTQLLDENNKKKQVVLRMVDMREEYTFPEEDFCLYADFPHSKLIFPAIESRPNLECTCTLVWLTQYYPYYSNMPDLITPSVSKCNHTRRFDELVKSCKFEQTITKCNLITTPAPALTSTSAITSILTFTNTNTPIIMSTRTETPLLTSTEFITASTITPDGTGVNIGVIIGSVIGGIAGITIIGVGGFLLFKKIIAKQMQVTPGTSVEMTDTNI